jgi:hypothetical protein
MAGPTLCQIRWNYVLASFDRQQEALTPNHSDAKEEKCVVRYALVITGQLFQTSPRVKGNGTVWKQLTEPRQRGGSSTNTLMSRHAAPVCCHTQRYEELSSYKKDAGEQAEANEEFCEQRKRKRCPSDEQAKKSKKAAVTKTAVKDGGYGCKPSYQRGTFCNPEGNHGEDSPQR